jgi:hypothetical protein
MGAPLERIERNIFRRRLADGTEKFALIVEAYGEPKKATYDSLKEARRQLPQVIVDHRKAIEEARAVAGAAAQAAVLEDGASYGFTTRAERWLAEYCGRTDRGIRQRSKDEYKRDLFLYAIPYWGEQDLRTIQNSDVYEFISWVAKGPAEWGKGHPDTGRSQGLRWGPKAMAAALDGVDGKAGRQMRRPSPRPPTPGSPPARAEPQAHRPGSPLDLSVGVGPSSVERR